MIVRSLTSEDLATGRLTALFAKRVSRLPAPMGGTVLSLTTWLSELMPADLDGTTALVADDGADQLVGLFVAIPVSILGDPVPVLGDLFMASRRPGAMGALLREAKRLAPRLGCRGVTATTGPLDDCAALAWAEKNRAVCVARSFLMEA
jgi:hypothetical protein